MQSYQQYLSLNPEVRFGKPIITGTRISVYDVLSWLSEGMSVTDIIADFPELSDKQILACLSYAADKEQHIAITA